MDIYHIWCNLKPGVRDMEFSTRISVFLDHLQGDGRIASYRVTRRKLGIGIEGLGEFHIMIEVTGLAQLDSAFEAAATRKDPLEDLHHRTNSLVTDFKAALYRDFPDEIREQGAEKF